ILFSALRSLSRLKRQLHCRMEVTKPCVNLSQEARVSRHMPCRVGLTIEFSNDFFDKRNPASGPLGPRDSPTLESSARPSTSLQTILGSDVNCFMCMRQDRGDVSSKLFKFGSTHVNVTKCVSVI